METRKIAIACFVGAALGVITSVLVHPFWWWIGLIAGAIVGYIAYDARAFLAAIPKAFRRAATCLSDTIANSQTSSGRSDIFIIGIALVGINITYLVAPPPKSDLPTALVWIVAVVFIPLIGSFVSFLLTMGGLWLGLKTWSEHTSVLEPNSLFHPSFAKTKRSVGREATYVSLFKWLVTGWLLGPFWILYHTLRGLCSFAVTVFWYATGIAGLIFGFVGVFFRELFLLVHSDKRLISAVDSMMGVLAGYLLYGRTAASAQEVIFAAVVGGIFGAGLGVLNYKIVSQHLIKRALQERA